MKTIEEDDCKQTWPRRSCHSVFRKVKSVLILLCNDVFSAYMTKFPKMEKALLYRTVILKGMRHTCVRYLGTNVRNLDRFGNRSYFNSDQIPISHVRNLSAFATDQGNSRCCDCKQSRRTLHNVSHGVSYLISLDVRFHCIIYIFYRPI